LQFMIRARKQVSYSTLYPIEFKEIRYHNSQVWLSTFNDADIWLLYLDCYSMRY
jgi:hypothetical protein